jgi:hypothetical protein
MDRSEYLKARGWVQHGAGLDLWRETHGGRESEWTDGDTANDIQIARDRATFRDAGSVRYYPTAEQAQTSPLLAACAARGMCEREVIGMLFGAVAEQQRVARRLADVAASPIRIVADEEAARMAAALKNAQAIAAAWKALARTYKRLRRADCLAAATAARADVESFEDAAEAVKVAKAALRALGIDPDATDEPGAGADVNEPTTEYQKTVAAGIAAAGHAVEWKPLHVSTSFATLHIDGVPCGSDLTGDRPDVAGVWGESGSAWAKRKLPADPRKAAAVLLDRLESVVYEAAQMKASAERSRARHAVQQQIVAAFGDVPGLLVEVHPACVLVTFRAADLDTEKAARLGDAIRAVLGQPPPSPTPTAEPFDRDEGADEEAWGGHYAAGIRP